MNFSGARLGRNTVGRYAALTVPPLAASQETCVQHVPSEHTAEIIEFSGAVTHSTQLDATVRAQG